MFSKGIIETCGFMFTEYYEQWWQLLRHIQSNFINWYYTRPTSISKSKFLSVPPFFSTILPKKPRKLKQLLMLFGLIFFSFFTFFCHKISFALDLIIQGKHAKQFGIHFFIYLRAYTQLVKITIVLLTSTALYQCKPVQQLACQVLAFQVTLPTYAVGFCFARWKVTYSANCTT